MINLLVLLLLLSPIVTDYEPRRQRHLRVVWQLEWNGMEWNYYYQLYYMLQPTRKTPFVWLRPVHKLRIWIFGASTQAESWLLVVDFPGQQGISWTPRLCRRMLGSRIPCLRIDRRSSRKSVNAKWLNAYTVTMGYYDTYTMMPPWALLRRLRAGFLIWSPEIGRGRRMQNTQCVTSKHAKHAMCGRGGRMQNTQW